jgi:[ribosomal protein S18]-alanine N-acetyltransferase
MKGAEGHEPNPQQGSQGIQGVQGIQGIQGVHGVQGVRAASALGAMRESDLDEVAGLERRAYPFPWTRGNFADSLRSGYDAWCVRERGRIIAYAVVMWLPEEVHLLNITVEPGFQGQGIGRRLLSWLIRQTRSRGAGSMLLEVRPSNEAARALYASMGFVMIGKRPRYYPSWDDTREDALVLRLTYAPE